MIMKSKLCKLIGLFIFVLILVICRVNLNKDNI